MSEVVISDDDSKPAEDLSFYDCEMEGGNESSRSHGDPQSDGHSGAAVSQNVSEVDVSPYQSRTSLPAVMFKRSNFAAFQLLRHLVGRDLTRITVPVIFDEPLTFLQRLAEYVENWHLLVEASNCDDALQRLERVTAFAVSASATNYERLNKPFNPLLGETYELKRERLGFHFVAEQVSHHPPISAFHCEVPGVFKLYGSFEPRMRFWGKHVHASPHGVLTLELPKHGEVYSWQNVHMNVHNIIIGKLWVELFGDLIVVEHTKGHRAVVTYKRAKWLSSDRQCVLEGFIEDPAQKKVRTLYGAWHEALFSAPVDHGNKQQSAKGAELEEVDSIKCDLHLAGQSLLWRVMPRPADAHLYYNFSYFAFLLNEISDDEKCLNLPPTDSRWRPDMRLLEQGDLQGAAEKKHSLEEKQRSAMREMKKLNLEWTPRWFNREAHPYRHMDTWVYNKRYLNRDWSSSPPIFNLD